MIATGSMDNTARLWDVETGECLHTLLGHTAEIVSLDFDTQGQRIITGSFDNTVKVWDVRNGRCIHSLVGHQGEISSCQFNFASDLCISGSIDRTCKVIAIFHSLVVRPVHNLPFARSSLCFSSFLFVRIIVLINLSFSCRYGMSEVVLVSIHCVDIMMKFLMSPFQQLVRNLLLHPLMVMHVYTIR